jgi:hypothetical protein
MKRKKGIKSEYPLAVTVYWPVLRMDNKFSGAFSLSHSLCCLLLNVKPTFISLYYVITLRKGKRRQTNERHNLCHAVTIN